ncbi:hypothetical protein [Shewanella colwelliana]|uniref:hypothetical protein n=1 Tax=Shewanella colwelliana TaxID=23 RepID=UPI001FE1B735|nr:hypothetical protein [Shewanella colwelliana]
MRLLWLVGSILLLIGGLCLSPMSASASAINQQHTLIAGNNLNAEGQPLSVQSAKVDTATMFNIMESSLKTSLDIESDVQGRYLQHKESKSSEYAPLVSQRLISFAQYERLHSRPDYQLVFEFISPPIPSLTVGYRMDFKPAVDWQLHIDGSSFRLSAWKESNLLYRLSHTRSAS